MRTRFCVQGVSKDNPSTCGLLLPPPCARSGQLARRRPAAKNSSKTPSSFLRVSPLVSVSDTSHPRIQKLFRSCYVHRLRCPGLPSCSLEAQGPSELQGSGMETAGERKRKQSSRESSGSESPQYTLKISRQSCR